MFSCRLPAFKRILSERFNVLDERASKKVLHFWWRVALSSISAALGGTMGLIKSAQLLNTFHKDNKDEANLSDNLTLKSFVTAVSFPQTIFWHSPGPTEIPSAMRAACVRACASDWCWCGKTPAVANITIFINHKHSYSSFSWLPSIF